MKNILVLLVVAIGLFFVSTAQAQSITIANEVLAHNDGFVDALDSDWLTFTVSGNTGGVPMMVRYGVQVPGSTSYRWFPFHIVNGPFSLNGVIFCAWNGVIVHADDYLVAAELRTYSDWTNGNLVTDDVAFFNHD